MSEQPIESKLTEQINMLLEATQNMGLVVQMMKANAQTSSDASSIVTQACQEMQSYIQTVAESVVQMRTEMGELVSYSNQVLQVSQQSLAIVASSKEQVAHLNSHSQEVGEILGVIRGITSQTNMLALNATIEAARVGEEGKGFAVVATEIKNLSRETAQSTENISAKITSMQENMSMVVENISEIDQVVSQLNQFQHSVNELIERQAMTSSTISTSVERSLVLSDSIAEQAKSLETSSVLITECIEDSVVAMEMLGEIAENVNQAASTPQAPAQTDSDPQASDKPESGKPSKGFSFMQFFTTKADRSL